MKEQNAKTTTKNTVCAVVVTFNRKNFLLECLESLCTQTEPPDAILIVDNASIDGTAKELKKRRYIKKEPPENQNNVWETGTEILSSTGKIIQFYYLRLPENTGGSGGFFYGMKKAYELGYQWIWTMDDDVIVDKKALEILKKYFYEPEVLALSTIVLTKERKIFVIHRGFFNLEKLFPNLQIPVPIEKYKDEKIPIEFSSFLGLMIKRDAISKVGLPNPDFFIYNDDVDYSLRLSRKGKILLIFHSIIIDQNAKEEIPLLSKKILFFKVKRIPIVNFWRTYYHLRNKIYIGRKYSKKKFFFFFKVFLHMIKSIRSLLPILLLDDYKKDRIKILFLPYIHGLKGTLGKKVEFKNGKIVWY